jgi:ABC-2 type transport system permease protein
VLAAFLRRDFRIGISYRASFTVEVIGSVLLLALFFYLGRLVDNADIRVDHNRSGSYFAYAAVGLALFSILQVGITLFSSKLREEQTTGTFEELMTTPASPSLIVLCSASYDFLRATVSGLVLLAVAVTIFGLRLNVTPSSLVTAVAAIVGCLGLFASVGIALASFTVVFKRSASLVGMALSALALLGGVYFPIEVLPTPIEQVARALPFTWGLDVMRASLLGGKVDVAQLGGLLVAAGLLLPVMMAVFRSAVRRARRQGTLAQY